MPILINDVLVELEPEGGPSGADASPADLTPLKPAEQELARMLALIDERRDRLLVD